MSETERKIMKLSNEGSFGLGRVSVVKRGTLYILYFDDETFHVTALWKMADCPKKLKTWLRREFGHRCKDRMVWEEL